MGKNDQHHYTNGTVLIADDNPDNLRVLSGILEAGGYRVRAAKSGMQAIKSVKLEKPDLIMLDIHMPELDGYETCRRLKSDTNYRDVPVLFISALSEVFNKVQAFQVGGLDYIVKPFQGEEVLARVGTHLALFKKTAALKDALEELKSTQAQLIQSEKMAALGVLTAGIAHEINNPLNFFSQSIDSLSVDFNELIQLIEVADAQLEGCGNISAASAWQKAKQKQDFVTLVAEVPDLLSEAKMGSNRVAEIVQSLRDFSRMESGEKVAYDLQEGLDSVLVMLRYRINDRIEVCKKYNNPPQVVAHPSMLNQLFMNLLCNAIDAVDATNAVKKVTIETGTAAYDGGEKVFVSVADSGVGIAEEIKNKIFDPFFTTKEVGSGVGLGLSICKTIIDGHNGELLVETNKGGGTIMKLFLPFTAA